MSNLLKKSYAALFKTGDFSVSEVAKKVTEEFDIGCGKDLISAENLALLVTELASERITSRIALITLNQHPRTDPEEARKQIDNLCVERFHQLLKISSRTTESNTARAIRIPDYVEFALYVAHIRHLEQEGKNPGWRKLKKRASDILGRSTHKRAEWIKFLTKSRIEKLLPTFREITKGPDYPSPDYVVWVTQFNWLVQKMGAP